MQNQSNNELDQLAEELTLRQEVGKYGDIFYYNEQDQIHRTHGPAVIWAHGSEEWYQNGELHRLDGPAIAHRGGTQYWYQNGKRHRLDGPAITWDDGGEYWFIDGTEYTKDEFNAHPLVVQYRANTAL